MTKINFTKEHMTRLQELSLKMLFGNFVIKGLLGTELNIYGLLHESTTNTLQTLNINLKKDIEKLESLDNWSLDAYQQRKITSLKEYQELVNLVIGYKKWQAQEADAKQQIKNLKAELKTIKSNNITPEEKMKEIEKRIQEMGGSVEDDDNETDTPV